jgi:hypothetical protein
MPPERDDDPDLETLLAELERTLTDLQAAVGEDATRRRRPPTPTEILRFTEEYTLPTLVALLETTVRSLELLRAVLRLADPERSLEDRLREEADAPDVTTLRSALTDLRSALTDPDLPEGTAGGAVIREARDLTAEIDERLDESTGGATEARPDDGRGSDRGDRDAGVDIDVTDEGETEDADVDVDAELESIRESVEAEDEDDED